MPKLTVSTDTGTKINTTVKTYSGADAGRYFKAWQARVGAKDVDGKPIGTEAEFCRWCADFIHAQLDSFVTQHEQQAVTAPPVDTVDQ